MPGMSEDEGKWVDDTNTRLVQGQDAEAQATGMTGIYNEAKYSP